MVVVLRGSGGNGIERVDPSRTFDPLISYGMLINHVAGTKKKKKLTGRPNSTRTHRNTADTAKRTMSARNSAGTQGTRPPNPKGITAVDSPCAHWSSLSTYSKNPSAIA